MKRTVILPIALAVFLAATMALAAKDRATATFQSLANSGVSGEVTLSSMPKGGTMIRGKVSGLEPNTEYVSLYYENGTCALEADSQNDVVARFRANPAGVAHFNQKVDENLDQIKSISVRLGSDINVLLACAPVTP